MAQISIAESRRLALERVRTVLAAQLGAEITASVAATSLALECPAPTGLFLQQTIDYTATARAHSCFVVIAPDAPRRIVQAASGGPSTYKATSELDVAIALAYQYRPQAPVSVGGVPLQADELMLRRGEVYLSALLNCLHKYLCDQVAVHDLTPISDVADVIAEDGFPAWGVAQLTLTLTQLLAIPQRRPLP
jgi:hypothetical protein